MSCKTYKLYSILSCDAEDKVNQTVFTCSELGRREGIVKILTCLFQHAVSRTHKPSTVHRERGCVSPSFTCFLFVLWTNNRQNDIGRFLLRTHNINILVITNIYSFKDSVVQKFTTDATSEHKPPVRVAWLRKVTQIVVLLHHSFICCYSIGQALVSVDSFYSDKVHVSFTCSSLSLGHFFAIKQFNVVYCH